MKTLGKSMVQKRGGGAGKRFKIGKTVMGRGGGWGLAEGLDGGEERGDTTECRLYG